MPATVRIGAYALVRRLSLVHLARTPDGAPCAVEIVELSGAPPSAHDLAREQARCAAASHPALARPRELFVHRDVLAGAYDVDAVVDLASVATRVRGAAAACVGHALAEALAAAHDAVDEEGVPAPVIHGRVRAGRVLLDRDGGVHLTGLGLGGMGPAPEQRAGGRVTPRADVYALGALLVDLGLGASGDLRSALAAATEPNADRRRTTAFELAAWLARSADLEAGRRDLRAVARAAEAASLPLSAPARVGVAAITAAVVFAAGVIVAESSRSVGPPATPDGGADGAVETGATASTADRPQR